MDQLLLEAFYVELERRFGELPASERPVFGVDERLRCERAVRLGGPWSMFRLRESLRACVVRRERQGAAFDLAFNTVFGIEKEEDLLVVLPQEGAEVAETPPDAALPPVVRRRIVGALGLLAMFGGVLVGLHEFGEPDEVVATAPPADEAPPEEQAPPEVVDTPNTDPFATWKSARRTTRLEATFTPGRDPRGAIAAALAAAALALLLGAWRWKRRVDAERLPPPAPPELAEGASPVALTVDTPRPREELLDAPAADLLADAVGVLLDVPVRPDLDVSATIGETARRGGFPTPILAGERHLHRVVVLGHTGSPARRDRPVDVELAEKLAARGVPASHAELRPGSTQLFPRVGTPTTLDRLHQNDAAAIVLVVGEPDRLEKELLRQLGAFKRVAVVAPMDPSVSGPGRLVFPVFHPTEAGWKALAQWVRQGVRPQDRPLPLLEPRLPPPRALEALGTGRPLQPDEERELERFLGPALPWAAALACLPLPVGPGLVATSREMLVGLARDAGLPGLADGVDGLGPTAVDLLHALAGSGPGEVIDLPGALREWLWARVLAARWPELHEALLRHHVATLDGLELAPGSQEGIDRDFALLVLRAWLARMSSDDAEVSRVATALRNFRHGARTGDQAQVWRESLIPQPQGELSPAAARLVRAAWTDVEWEPWTAGRRAAGIAALAGAAAVCAGGVAVATSTEEPTIKVEGDYFAWWQDGYLAVRDGAFTQTGLLPKPAAGVSGTITFDRVDDPNGPPCVEYEEPETWWVRCGAKGEFTTGERYVVATGSLADFEDPRVARVLGWMFRAGTVQGAYVGKEGAEIERRLFGWEGEIDRERLVGGGAGPAAGDLQVLTLDLEAISEVGASLLVESEGRNTLPMGTVDLSCFASSGQAIDCELRATFEGGPALAGDADIMLEPGRHRIAAGEWSVVVVGHEATRSSLSVAAIGRTTAMKRFVIDAPVAGATLKLDEGVTATIDGVAWDGQVRELAEGPHRLVLTRGCPEKVYDVVVGDGEAPKGAIRLRAGVDKAQPIVAAAPQLHELRLETTTSPLPIGTAVLVRDEIEIDGRGPYGTVGADGLMSGIWRVPLACGEHTVTMSAVATSTRDGVTTMATITGNAVISVTPYRVVVPDPAVTFVVPDEVPSPSTIQAGGEPASTLWGTPQTVDTIDGKKLYLFPKAGSTTDATQATATAVRPQPCDGGALPTGGPTGARINVDVKGFLQPMEFVVLSGGTFAMGSPADEEGRDDDETCHRVTLSPFAIATTEVSQNQWQTVMGSNPSTLSSQGANLKGDSFAVQHISWCDAALFANKLSEQTGRTAAYTVTGGCENGGTVSWDRKATGFIFPTEAQWEYAARGGTADTYGGTWDPAEMCRFANVSDATAKARFPDRDTFGCDDGAVGLASVRSGAANPWGLHQVSGNVLEWVWDAYGDYPGGRDPAADAGFDVVFRGGAWTALRGWARVADRHRDWRRARFSDLGLRLALPAPTAGR